MRRGDAQKSFVYTAKLPCASHVVKMEQQCIINNNEIGIKLIEN